MKSKKFKDGFQIFKVLFTEEDLFAFEKGILLGIANRIALSTDSENCRYKITE
jgi:hypothetical protein